MSQNLSVNSFMWVENTFHINEDFKNNYNEENVKDIFLKLMFDILKCYMIFTMI